MRVCKVAFVLSCLYTAPVAVMAQTYFLQAPQQHMYYVQPNAGATMVIPQQHFVPQQIFHPQFQQPFVQYHPSMQPYAGATMMFPQQYYVPQPVFQPQFHFLPNWRR